MVVTLEHVLLLSPVLMGCGGLQVIYPLSRESLLTYLSPVRRRLQLYQRWQYGR